MMMSRFNARRLANLLETSLIMTALLGLLLFIAWLFAGMIGILFVCVAAIPALVIGGARAGRLILRMYQASPLSFSSSPGLVALLGEICQRAELPDVPQLFYIPSKAPLAFSVGLGKGGAIALSDGLLRMLSWRELVGVLAHEVGHIARKDTRVMGIADVASRLVWAISLTGQLLFLLNLPFYLFGNVGLPWLPLLIMIAAPVSMALLQLALSRTREYEADRLAAQLTNDPLGLAAALERMELAQRQLLRRSFVSSGKLDGPSILRTHPGTARRIERLAELARDLELHSPAGYTHTDGLKHPLEGVDAPGRQPRRRFLGHWF